ncbi:MAG: hypothetical protein HY678_11240, partial [Chloroflexi bacterium]|nr:hypothetical protein [Chloroflexota bacterium]
LLARLDASRTYALAGLLLLVSAMLLGEIYAIYISYTANATIRESWMNVVEAAAAGKTQSVAENFATIYDLADKRGRIMNTHSHMGAFGLLALALAILQPLLPASASLKRRTAWIFVLGAVLQFGCVYLSYYVGPWALYLADAGAVLVILAVAVVLWLLLRRQEAGAALHDLVKNLARPAASRFLLRAGLLLILLGMLFGLFYAWRLTAHDEPGMYQALDSAIAAAEGGDIAAAADHIGQFKRLQSKIAITAGAHSHAIEFGFLMLLLAFIQSHVFLSEAWRMRWSGILAAGAYLLPLCVYLATLYGLRAAAFADLAGGLVVAGLFAMSIGVVRYTGAADYAGTEKL